MHVALIPEFQAALERLIQDELTLLRLSFPLHDPELPYMQRFFRFNSQHIAIFEWNHANRSIRIHTCRKEGQHPEAA
jgi:hypothetical protein